jgi:hypothetical protein
LVQRPPMRTRAASAAPAAIRTRRLVESVMFHHAPSRESAIAAMVAVAAAAVFACGVGLRVAGFLIGFLIGFAVFFAVFVAVFVATVFFTVFVAVFFVVAILHAPWLNDDPTHRAAIQV